MRDSHIYHMAEMLRFFFSQALTVSARVLGTGNSNEDQVKFQASQNIKIKCPVFSPSLWINSWVRHWWSTDIQLHSV